MSKIASKTIRGQIYFSIVSLILFHGRRLVHPVVYDIQKQSSILDLFPRGLGEQLPSPAGVTPVRLITERSRFCPRREARGSVCVNRQPRVKHRENTMSRDKRTN